MGDLINKTSLNFLFEQVFNKNGNNIFCYLLDSKKVNLAIKEGIVILDLLNLNFSMYKKLDQFLKKPQFESSWCVNEKVNTYVYFNEQQKEISFYKYNIELIDNTINKNQENLKKLCDFVDKSIVNKIFKPLSELHKCIYAKIDVNLSKNSLLKSNEIPKTKYTISITVLLQNTTNI
jgi:hypothetical protein